MNKNRFPRGWDEERVRRVIAHYEGQTEEEAVAEIEAAFEKQTWDRMEFHDKLLSIGLGELGLRQARFDSLRKYRQERYRKLEGLRQEFVETFAVARIRNMCKDDYVEGRIVNGEPNRNTFCYWIEWKTRGLGGMQGATASKFGLYVDRKSQEYRFTKRFVNEDQAIDCIRKEIVRLIELGESKDLKNIKKISLSPMFRGKILFLYFPDDFINILSEKHVDYFLKGVGVYQESKDLHLIDKREVLFSWKNTDMVMKKWNMFEFSDFLHTEIGEPSKIMEGGIDLPDGLFSKGTWRFSRPRPDKAALHKLVGTLTHEEAKEMQKLIDEEFERVEGEW